MPLRLKKKILLAVPALAAALALSASVAAAASTQPAAPHHSLPSISQWLREGKIKPTPGERLLPRNNCTSNYESPFLYGSVPALKYFDLWKMSNNPPEMQAISDGGRTNYCFYVISGTVYDVIQQANTQNCQFWNQTHHVVDEAACNIASPSDQWELDLYYQGQVVNKFNGYCMASEAPNAGPAVVYTTDGDYCYNGGTLQTSWHSVP